YRNGIDPGPIDGDYGPMTSEAVRQFQQWYDLPVTGVAGPETLDILGVVEAPSSIGEVANDVDFDLDGERPYVAAITGSTRKLGQVQRSFRNATLDSARQGNFINIGSYDSRSAAAEQVRAARRLGFDARTLYKP
ncbi:MAG: peptidoglycan-binding protein, partial [Leptolyngbya sp. SIO3F4]|nr:peptidoglycan-binding protein [Leptolyngbya sp. SIO3F4]